MGERMKKLASTALMVVMVLSLFGALMILPAGAAVQPPQLITYAITNTTITPPQTASIDVKFSERVEAWIKIEDSDRNQVKQLYHSSGVTDPFPKTWDGTYTNGTQVIDGDYYVNVTGINFTTPELSVVNNTEKITVTSGAEPITVTRSYVKGTDPGTAVVTVSSTINAEIPVLGITEDLPSGWNITEQSSSPPAEYSPTAHGWIYITPPTTGESGTITYTVSGPAGDTDTISGTYAINGGPVETPSTNVTLTGANEIDITFVSPPTPANGTTMSVNYVNVTVSIAQTDISTVLLNWNGVNETMNAAGLNSWSYTKTGLANGTYIYKVYANDTLDNWGVSETRTVTIPELVGATVTGTIKGINQEPINGATVTINGYAGTTDATGNYTITNVLTGTYNVTANATGYREETETGVSIDSDMEINFTGDDGLLKECPVSMTYVLQVIIKWKEGEITDMTKVLSQIIIWKFC